MEELTNKKHLAFVDALFANNFNATKSYLIAFNTDNEASARALGSKLLSNVSIKNEIARRQAQLDSYGTITRREILDDLIEIKNSNKNTFAGNSLKAIEIINKMLGYNEPDKVEQSGNVGFDFNVEIKHTAAGKILSQSKRKAIDAIEPEQNIDIVGKILADKNPETPTDTNTSETQDFLNDEENSNDEN